MDTYCKKEGVNMKQKKFVSMVGILAILMSSVFIIGCTSMKPVRDPGLTVKLAENQYEVLGRVVYKGSAHNVLGLISWGGAAYNKLYEQAKQEFDADDVINLSIDYEDYLVGIFYNRRTYIMSGLAIKYKK